MRSRLLVLTLQLVLCVQAGFVAAVIPAGAAPVRAAGECQVTSGSTGGMVSSCPDATSYADMVDGLELGVDNVRGGLATSSLSVTSEPTGATVIVNGLDLGRTPIQTRLPAGSYLVRITADGYVPYSTSVNVDAASPASVSATLTRGTAGQGSFNWLRASSLNGLTGGYPNGDMSVTGFVQDRDGAYWISFINFADVETTVDAPIDVPFFHNVQTTLRTQLRVTGVAKSIDAGSSWSIVKTWRDNFSARAWTSDKFIDSDWDPEAEGFPAELKPHWLRVWYQERSVESYVVFELIPREEGGVAIVLNAYRAHLPQEVQLAYDNVGKQNYPGEFMGTLVEPAGDGTHRTVSSGEAMAKWGVSREDLASYEWQVSADSGQRIVTADGNEQAMEVGGPTSDVRTRAAYQGSHDGVDYFLAYEQTSPGNIGANGYLYASRDGGRNLTLETTYPLQGNSLGRMPYEELRIGPDGTRYLLEHLQIVNGEIGSSVYILADNGTVHLLGKTPPNLNFGVAGGNNLPFLSADFDSAGNVHAAFRASKGQQDNSAINVYYQFFPREPVSYDSVALLTAADCPACDSAAAFLRDASVTFAQNPDNLPAEVANSVAEQAGTAGYPVLVRLGDETVVRGGADVPTISRLLGVSQPVLVETHPPRVASDVQSAVLPVQPQWLLMVVEDDQPHIVVDRRDGIVALSPADGEWLATPLLATPPSVLDEPRVGHSKRYPMFPGGSNGGFISTQHDVPFNHIDRLADFVYLYQSAAVSVPDGFGETNEQFDYTLWTTAEPEQSSAYRAISKASQLIPAATFYLALGEKGEPSSVGGELAQYVTGQSVVTDDGYRFYRVEVDLRAQNETAVDGNIVARAIGGYVNVESETEEGAPETRQVSLILLVDNTRLRAFDPDTPDSARDVSVEAVHFGAPDERWVVTNNIALPNSVPCGPDQALLLEPNTFATFSAATVGDFELQSCLAALEVEPTVISGCSSWDDAKLVIAADTIDSLAQSLPLMRSAGVTNYELAFGRREATVFRIVSLDQTPAGGPICASEVTGKSAALVRVEGRILGSNEPFAPTLTIVDQGSVMVSTSSTALPPTIAWQRDWLEMESAFLELSLKLSVDEEALWDYISFSSSDRRSQYQTELLATRALLHCNYEGRDIAAVRELMSRTDAGSDALLGVAHCLQDFVVEPYKHWSHANTHLWAGRTVSFMGSVINTSLSSNPTLAFLVSDAAADPALYGRLIIDRARNLEAKAGASIRGLALDYALDHYARLLTATSASMGGGARAGIMRAVLVASPLERLAVRNVLACARSFGVANPFGQLVELTKARSYTAGIPCVDSQASGQAKIDTYRRLALGMRGGLFGAIFEAAGNDLDLLNGYLDMVSGVMDEVDAVEQRYGPGTRIDSWQPDQPALVRFTIVRRHLESLVQARGKRVTVGEAKAVLSGVVECGVGLVKTFFSAEGVLLLGLGIGAAAAGPFSAAVGGMLFLGSGVAFTGLAVNDLAQAWEGLDLASRTAGICGATMSAILTVGAARGVVALNRRTAAQLRASPPRVIEEGTLPSTGRAAGLPLQEQAEALTNGGGSVRAPTAPPVTPLDPIVRALVDSVPEGKKAKVVATAEQLGYRGLPAEARAAFDELVQTYGSDASGLRRAFQQRREQIDALISAGKKADSPELLAWVDTGAQLLAELMPGRPKSLSIDSIPAQAVGRDAALVRAVAGDVEFLGAVEDVANSRGGNAALQSSTSLMQAFLRSARLRDVLQWGSPGQRALTAEEVFYLQRLRRNAGSAVNDGLLSELGRARLTDALRQALADSGVPVTEITAMDAEMLAVASYKTVFRLTVSRAGQAEPTSVVVKLGVIEKAEVDLLGQLAADDLSAKPLSPLLERANGNEAVSIDEFLAGDEPGSAWLQSLLTGNPDLTIPRATGGWDALAYVRTAKGSSSGYFNADFHLANYIRLITGRLKAIDVDPRMGRTVSERLYFAASLLRRNVHPDYRFGFGATGFEAYLDGLTEVLRQELGDARTRQILEAARDDIRDPAVQTQVKQLQDRSRVTGVQGIDFVDAELPADATATANAIDTYLSSH